MNANRINQSINQSINRVFKTVHLRLASALILIVRWNRPAQMEYYDEESEDSQSEEELLCICGDKELIVDQLSEAKEASGLKIIQMRGVTFDDDVVSATVDFFRGLAEQDHPMEQLLLEDCAGRIGEMIQEAKAFANITIDSQAQIYTGEQLSSTLKGICTGMRCNPNLKKVGLHKFSMSAEEGRMLGEGLKTAGSHFKELALVDAEFDETCIRGDMELILDQLSEAKEASRLKIIQLRGVTFDDDVVSATVDFFRGLAEQDHPMEQLLLENCAGRLGEMIEKANAFAKIRIDGLMPVGDAEFDTMFLTSAGFPQCSSLEQLCVESCFLSGSDVRWIAENLVSHPSLKALTLDGLDWGPEGLESLSTLLNNGRLESLSLHARLATLSKREMKILAEALKGNLNLKELDLSHNCIDDEALKMLTSTLGSYPCRIERLDLGHNRITSQGLEAFASVQISSCLKCLHLDNNPFNCEDGDGVARRYLLEALQLNHQLGQIEHRRIRSGLYPPDVRHLIDLNWCGRVLLGKNTSVHLAIWPLVLERANTVFSEEFDEEQRRANVIWHLLQGPALMQRRFDSVGVGDKRSADNIHIPARDQLHVRARRGDEAPAGM
jgi:hypothetical protein